MRYLLLIIGICGGSVSLFFFVKAMITGDQHIWNLSTAGLFFFTGVGVVDMGFLTERLRYLSAGGVSAVLGTYLLGVLFYQTL